MAFKRFRATPSAGTPRPDGFVTLTPHGLTMSKSFIAALGSPSSLAIEWDADSRRIRIVAAEEGEVDSRRVNPTTKTISCRLFLSGVVGWTGKGWRRREPCAPVDGRKAIIIDLKRDERS